MQVDGSVMSVVAVAGVGGNATGGQAGAGASSAHAGGSATGVIATIGAGSIIDAAGAAGASLSVPMPFQNKIVLLEDARVAGTTHVRGIDEIVGQLEIGTALRFVRDPGNLVDNWAIKVYAGESRIGYVPADCNEVLARLMDGGKALSGKLTGKEKLGNWNKLHMEVSLDD